jgi:hypothetical protein
MSDHADTARRFKERGSEAAGTSGAAESNLEKICGSGVER